MVKAAGALRRGQGSLHTHPLFPELPQYGPPTLFRELQSTAYRVASFVLSLSFLAVIVVSAMVRTASETLHHAAAYLTLRNPDASRPFHAEEKRRRQLRRDLASSWKRHHRLSQKRAHRRGQPVPLPLPGDDKEDPAGAGVGDSTYTPTEGGPDQLVCDVGYYARRVGLDVEPFVVQTEDGFLIDLWHVYDPAQHQRRPAAARGPLGPRLLFDETDEAEREARQQQMFAERLEAGQRQARFPVLLVHGLLQSAGAYAVNDDDSLAFYLAKSGFDVWLGNNRCGFRPRHVSLKPDDPRMWRWNIRHMGVFDLPALVSRVLRETRFARLGLVCHSQGTTETLVALAKEQRPQLGRCLSVFCALAPAAYAGPLIGKLHFKVMHAIAPAVFRLVFGRHAFIPVMMMMQPVLPPRLYGWLGYRVFSFLLNWTDARWDRGLRDRMFQFAPVHVSAESMYWWLGSEGFSHHKCILATKEEDRAEECEMEQVQADAPLGQQDQQDQQGQHGQQPEHRDQRHRYAPGARAWYDEQVPPFALWVCGRDDLVDGRRLLRRLLPGPAFASLYGPAAAAADSLVASSGCGRSVREPHVRVVHAKLLPEYEHLDILWAMDAVDQVFCEIRDVLWKTCSARDGCQVPKGCANVAAWVDGEIAADTVATDDDEETSSSSAGDSYE